METESPCQVRFPVVRSRFGVSNLQFRSNITYQLLPEDANIVAPRRG